MFYLLAPIGLFVFLFFNVILTIILFLKYIIKSSNGEGKWHEL